MYDLHNRFTSFTVHLIITILSFAYVRQTLSYGKHSLCTMVLYISLLSVIISTTDTKCVDARGLWIKGLWSICSNLVDNLCRNQSVTEGCPVTCNACDGSCIRVPTTSSPSTSYPTQSPTTIFPSMSLIGKQFNGLRVWATSDMLVNYGGYNWWSVQRIRLYSNFDCTGTTHNDGTPISS